MKNVNKAKSIIYSILAIIVAIIGIRILLELIGANPNTPFVEFWIDLSNIFIGPLIGMFPDIQLGSNSVILVSGCIAALFYVLFAIALDTSVTKLQTPSTSRQMLYMIINGIFKVIEFLLITRFVLIFLDASTKSTFVQFIYEITDIIYAPFAGIINDIQIMGITIELSTLLILVIVIIIDIAFDQLMVSTLEQPEKVRRIRRRSH